MDFDKILSDMGVKKGSELNELEYIETDMYLFNNVLRFAKGRWYILYGREGSCKSTLSYYLGGCITKKKEYVLVVDIENSYDHEWSIKQGINPEYLLVMPVSDTFEKTADKIRDLLKAAQEANKQIGMVIVDSIQAAYTKAEKETYEQSLEGDPIMATLAKKITAFVRVMTPILAKANCTAIVIGQARDSMGYGGGIQLTGGHAMKHIASMILRLSTTGKKDQIIEDGKVVGWPIEVRVDKSRSAEDKNIYTFMFRKDVGIDPIGSNCRLALARGIIVRKGAYYAIGEKQFRGWKGLLDAIYENPELQSLILSKLSGEADEEEE